MKVLIIEDHPITAFGTESLLRKHYSDLVARVAGDGATSTKLLDQTDFDLVILDILLPKTDAQTLLVNIKARKPQVKILVYSGCSEDVYARKFASLGANGFVKKAANDEDFLLAVKTVMSNNLFLPLGTGLSEQRYIYENPFRSLSKRELEVLNHLLSGSSIKQIAQTMNLGVSTIATQKARIFNKLGTDNLVDLYHLANQYGLFTNIAENN